jgi:hypothetical protein
MTQSWIASTFALRAMADAVVALSEAVTSRKPALAAKPDALLGFQLRHLEQAHQHAESMTTRHPSKVGDGLCNEGGGLVRPAIPYRIIALRAAIPARGRELPPFA